MIGLDRFTMARQVRTRFAPSPTGYMHIGGMRTALFVWLWARHNHGKFILRIDDTDQERNVAEALEPIFRAFRWLGLDWDEGPDIGGPFGPYYQSQRTANYQEVCDRLIAEGKAFRDYDPPELTQADRETAEKAKLPYLNIRRSLDLTDAQREQYAAEGRPYVVRFLIPREKKVSLVDAVRGEIEWDCSLMPDPVISRSNGTFLYNFATVVDDAQMHITDVIRAEEHLTNTAVQVLLHRALGNPTPLFAHIPFITAPGETKKLSKRDLVRMRNNPQLKKLFDRGDQVFPQLGLGDSTALNPVMVEYYERIGYLPAAIVNYLSRIGWSLDDHTETMPRSTVIENFTLDRIVKKPAALDVGKLQSFQEYWMSTLSLEEKVTGCLPYLQRAGHLPANHQLISAAQREFVGRVVTAMEKRLLIFSDILDFSEFFVSDEQLEFDDQVMRKRLIEPAEAQSLLQQVTAELLNSITPFTATTIDPALHAWMEQRELKMNQIVHALRIATTGRGVGLGLFDALELLGRGSTLRRIERALERARSLA